ncbi:F-box only protein 42 [Gamsiella multidivaricata]|nr:F-box only protein 42 [Gamsiella multidivaricata]
MLSFVSNSSTASTQGNLLVLDTNFWTWSIPNSPNSASAPASRLGAAVGVSNQTVFIHGGAAVNDYNGYATSNVLNDLSKLDDSTFVWTSIANGPALMYHTMCKLPGINKMIIFGGSDTTTNTFNTVHTFDLSREVWELAVTVNPGSDGGVPSARKGHTAACLNDTMVVFGGGVDGPQDDDVWVMNASVSPWVWNRMQTNKQAGPGSRTGHSALLNGTNMLVWGGYGAPLANDTNIYILDTLAWQWSSSRDVVKSAPVSPQPSTNAPGNSKIPLTIGVVCGSLASIAAFVGFLVFKRRASRRSATQPKHVSDNASYLSDAERHLSGDIGLDDKPSYYHLHAGRDSGSSLGGWPAIASRRNIPQTPQGYPMRSMSTPQPGSETDSPAGEDVGLAGSGKSMDQARAQHAQPALRVSQNDPGQVSQGTGTRSGSIASDSFYPAHLAENDEEDADRWTFASSLSFDQREKAGHVPTLRYIPIRPSGISGVQRSMAQSTGSLTPSYSVSKGPRRDGSAQSILSKKSPSIGPASTTLGPTATNAPSLSRDGSISTRDAALFNSVSPLDRVSLMCSGLEADSQISGHDEAVSTAHLHPRTNFPQWRDNYRRESFIKSTVDEEEEESHITIHRTGSSSTGHSSTTYTTLDHPAMVTLIQNLPARYLVSKSPSPIHGAVNDILFAVDSDTQQPIVIKSFARREAWERECRMLRRLRGPCVVELKHVATLVLSETDDPNKPAKVRLTILERLDETLAQMLKNARKAKKLALREQARSRGEIGPVDLSGVALYRSGPALGENHIKDIVKGVLRCLRWCHSKKVVYCGLKPTNIMRNRDDPRQQWKLIDMESSRVAEEEQTGVGTMRYCPPEVARAALRSATAEKGTGSFSSLRTGVTAQYSMDLWAFGCLLYELFATRPLISISVKDEELLNFLANPSVDTPALPNGLRWRSSQELEIPYLDQAVRDKSAKDLICMLLNPDPASRATMDQVLNSEYLNASSQEYTSTS